MRIIQTQVPKEPKTEKAKWQVITENTGFTNARLTRFAENSRMWHSDFSKSIFFDECRHLVRDAAFGMKVELNETQIEIIAATITSGRGIDGNLVCYEARKKERWNPFEQLDILMRGGTLRREMSIELRAIANKVANAVREAGSLVAEKIA